MKNTKRSVTFKIIAGYILAGIIAITAFKVIYQQITAYTQITEIKNHNNEKLFLVGETITGLYEAESLARNIIQTSDVVKFKAYKKKIDTILMKINKVSKISDKLQSQKIDNIKLLIDSKINNLTALIKIYEERKEKGIYETVINRLELENKNYTYKNDQKIRFKKYDPRTRKALINLLEYTKVDNDRRLTTLTIDSLASSIKKILVELEAKDNKYKEEISYKENELLKNDQIISKQLRDILTAIDVNERKQYLERLEASNEVINNTADIILIIASVSFLVAILFLFLITKDVSKSQKYRNELEEEKSYTEKLLTTRESLINTVTHDLRSPLNTVIGYSDLLEKTTLDTKQKHYLDHLKKSSDYILHLVNDLLDLSKLEAGKMVIEELPFIPKELIENTITSVIPVNDKKKLKINVFTSLELNNTYLSDPFRIKQILINLLHNAYKFTDCGSITINSYIEEGDLPQKQLIIAITDTGIGINDEQQSRIFNEFSQGDATTEKKYGGFGLGLAITKKIITLLDGDITLKSEVNSGSEFTICIPIHDSSLIIPETESTTKIQTKFSNQKVLIVDDDPSQLALTSEVVSLAGLAYDICNDGVEALKLLLHHKYNLILTDIQMPKMNGFELIENIKNNETLSKIPVIALSGRTNVSPQEYNNAGFTDSLQKPYAPQELINRIARIINVDAMHIEATNSSASKKEYSLSDLMLFAQGDTESLNAILDTFYTGTSDNINDLKQILKEKRFNQIKSVAHKMLPMFKQIKAKKIIPILQELEHPKSNNISDEILPTKTKEGIKEVEKLIKLIKKEN